jgi:hypothetical protein
VLLSSVDQSLEKEADGSFGPVKNHLPPTVRGTRHDLVVPGASHGHTLTRSGWCSPSVGRRTQQSAPRCRTEAERLDWLGEPQRGRAHESEASRLRSADPRRLPPPCPCIARSAFYSQTPYAPLLPAGAVRPHPGVHFAAFARSRPDEIGYAAPWKRPRPWRPRNGGVDRLNADWPGLGLDFVQPCNGYCALTAVSAEPKSDISNVPHLCLWVRPLSGPHPLRHQPTGQPVPTPPPPLSGTGIEGHPGGTASTTMPPAR